MDARLPNSIRRRIVSKYKHCDCEFGICINLRSLKEFAGLVFIMRLKVNYINSIVYLVKMKMSTDDLVNRDII